MRCPFVILYKVGLLTYLMGRMLVKVPYLGMVNIIAGRRLCPEFIQEQALPEKVAAELEPLLREGKTRADMLHGLNEVVQKLGSPGSTANAAEIILRELEKEKSTG